MASDIKQTIKDFYKVAQSRDFTRKYQFRILDVANKGSSVFDQDDLVYATTAILPGKSIGIIPVPYSGFAFRVPGTVSYNNADAFNINFYCDSNTNARIKMENWIEETFSDETTTGDGLLHNDSTITLAQLDVQFDVKRTYKLFGVFPKSVGDLEYSMTDTGEIVKVQCTFAYQFYRRDNEIS